MEPHYNAYATSILQKHHDSKGNGYPTVEVYTSISATDANLIFIRVCKVTNELYKVVADIEKVYKWLVSGELIQNALPDLSPEQRDFLLMNLTPAEMEIMLPDSEEDLNEAIDQAYIEVIKAKEKYNQDEDPEPDYDRMYEELTDFDDPF